MTIARRSLIVSLSLLSLLAAGCEGLDRPPANVDLSTPKSAALVYLKAIQRGDSTLARKVSVGSADEKRWVDALAVMVDGMRSFDNALYAKFGRYSHQVHTDLGNSLMMMADGPIEWIGEGSVAADDIKARIDPKRHGFASKFQPSLYLLLGKYGWQVNLEQTYASGATPAQLREMSASFAMYRQFGQALRATAREVMAGKFRSIDQANDALGARTAAIKSDAASE